MTGGGKLRVAVNARLLVGQPLAGMHRYTLEVTRALLRDTDAELLLLTDRAGDLPALPRAVDRVTLAPPTRHPALIYAWFEWRLPRALKAWGADVFLSMDNFCSLRAQVPTVLVVHDLAYRHFPRGVSPLVLAFYRRYMPRYVRRAEAVLAVSEFTRRDIIGAFGVPPERVGIAYNGVQAAYTPGVGRRADAEAVTHTEVADGNPYFICVGAVHPRKNVDGLLRAFDLFCASAPDLPHHLVIAGSMAWRTEAVGAALARSPNAERIHVLGYVPTGRLAALVAAAEALALVSHFEGFGVPIVEALNLGVPVLVSDRSSLPEVAGPGGILVDPDSAVSIAGGLERLARAPELRARLVEAGREHVAQFTWARTGAVIAEAIGRVAARST